MDYFWGKIILLTPGFWSELQRMKLSLSHVQFLMLLVYLKLIGIGHAWDDVWYIHSSMYKYDISHDFQKDKLPTLSTLRTMYTHSFVYKNDKFPEFQKAKLPTPSLRMTLKPRSLAPTLGFWRPKLMPLYSDIYRASLPNHEALSCVWWDLTGVIPPQKFGHTNHLTPRDALQAKGRQKKPSSIGIRK